jgi:hypothetical protein
MEARNRIAAWICALCLVPALLPLFFIALSDRLGFEEDYTLLEALAVVRTVPFAPLLWDTLIWGGFIALALVMVTLLFRRQERSRARITLASMAVLAWPITVVFYSANYGSLHLLAELLYIGEKVVLAPMEVTNITREYAIALSGTPQSGEEWGEDFGFMSTSLLILWAFFWCLLLAWEIAADRRVRKQDAEG